MLNNAELHIDDLSNINHYWKESQKYDFKWVWKAMVEYMKKKEWVKVITVTDISLKKGIYEGFNDMTLEEMDKYEWSEIWYKSD